MNFYWDICFYIRINCWICIYSKTF